MAADPPARPDPRNFSNGRLIPAENYCDQPRIVVTKDGTWVCVLTTGTGSIFGFLVARQAYQSAVLAPLFIVLSFGWGLAVFLIVQAALYAWTGRTLPARHDWDDPLYRLWIQWNYERRLEIWDLNNRVTKAAGGPDCESVVLRCRRRRRTRPGPIGSLRAR